MQENSGLLGYAKAAFAVLVIFFLFFASKYNYNLFHVIADGVSIVVATCAFVILWNSRRFKDNDYFTLVGIALVFFAILDFAHVLGNKNMGVFPGYGNLGPTFYIASRYVLSISLVLAPLFIKRKLNAVLAFLSYIVVTCLVLLSVFYWRNFPACIVEGVGLTPFKVISDYVTCIILAGAGIVMFANRQSFDPRVFRTITFSILFFIATGLAFTLYRDPFDIANLVGHLFQIASFYLLYLAIVETSLTKPQEIVFRRLKLSEEALTKNVRELDRMNSELQQEIAERKQVGDALRQSEERFLKAFRSNPAALSIIDSSDRTIVDINGAYERVLGYSRTDVIGRKSTDFDLYVNYEDRAEVLRLLTENGEVHDLDIALKRKDGQPIETVVSLERIVVGERTLILSSVTDVTDRKRAERALEESEKQYRLLFAANPNPMYVFDEETFRFLAVNDAAVSHYGWSRKEFLDMTVLDIRPPEDRRLAEDAARHYQGAHETAIGTYRHCRKDGTIREMEITVSSIVFDGRPGRLCSMNDVTERNRIDRALHESEMRFRLALSNAPVSVAVQDADLRYVWAYNQRTVDPSELIGKLDSEIFPEEEATRLTAIKQRVLREGVELREQMWFDRPGGPMFLDLYWEPIRDELGQTIGVGSATVNLTPMKLSEEASAKSEAKYRNLFENMTEEVHFWELVRDDDGNVRTFRLVDANPPALKTWGKVLDEIRGQTTDEIFGPGATEHYMPIVQRIMSEGAVFVSEDYFPNLDKYFRFSSVPLGEYFITTAADITTAKKAQMLVEQQNVELEKRVGERTAELREAYDKLMYETNEREQAQAQLRQAQKMEALGTLAGGIAHDFNNLLAAVIGFTELIKDHVPKGSREQHHAERVIEAGVRGRELVRQMLTFSRGSKEEKKPLRLSSIIKESVKLLRASIPTTVSIAVNLRNESGLILGDPVQVQQVLMNLATNAAFSMRDKGGTLDIELSDFNRSCSTGNLNGVEPGTYMLLTVRDTGMGIAPDIIDRVFDPFFTTKKVGEGTGLGLSVVMGIVKQAGGSITVESSPGEGSTFTVYWPKAGDEGNAEQPFLVEEAPLGRESILFVDDEEALVEMGEEVLADLGYQVHCMNSAKEALALFRLDPSRFDLVLTDQTMPGMTGIELTAELLVIRPDLPVILCTGFSHTVTEESAEAAGIRGFAMKPLTKQEIAKVLRKVLDG
jgi:PAS domain S-box-containing protein